MLLPEDLKGLKMRIQSSKVLEAQMRALGAIPQVMAFSEVYQALQTGVVDGQENTPSNMYTQKMHEVQKYASLSDHGVISYAVIVNKKFWDGLPADVRTALEGAMKQATAYNNQISEKENDDALAAMKTSGKIELHAQTPAERSAWIAKLRVVHKEVAPRVGAELIGEIYQATGQTP
jgi:C4-dicarboxylate-binding protein DctP